MEAVTQDPVPSTPPLGPSAVRVRQLSPANGEEELFRWRLAGGRTARLLFQGQATRAEIEKLIKYLDLAKDDFPESTTD